MVTVDQQLTYEQAIEWCERRQVTVSFLRIHGHARVQIRFGLAIIVERNTFLEAAHGANLIEQAESRPPNIVLEAHAEPALERY